MVAGRSLLAVDDEDGRAWAACGVLDLAGGAEPRPMVSNRSGDDVDRSSLALTEWKN